jgi:Tfp pilus assembly protein PilF
MFEKAISLHSSLYEPHYPLGNLALQKDRTGQAKNYLKRAAELDPRSIKVHFALERLYRKLGQVDKVAQRA